MKKTYLTPSQRVVDIELESLIADSPTSFSLDDEFNVGNEEDVMTKKNNNLWDNIW